MDACADPEVVRAVAARREQTVCVSGLTGEGLGEMLERVSAKLQDSMVAVHVLIPYAQVGTGARGWGSCWLAAGGTVVPLYAGVFVRAGAGAALF